MNEQSVQALPVLLVASMVKPTSGAAYTRLYVQLLTGSGEGRTVACTVHKPEQIQETVVTMADSRDHRTATSGPLTTGSGNLHFVRSPGNSRHTEICIPMVYT